MLTGLAGTLASQVGIQPAFAAGSPITVVAAGQFHTCAVTSVGTVKCWGYNLYGQVGDGSNNNERMTPVDVTGLSSATAVAAGRFHSCALRSTGGVRCWGYNSWGQLGDGTNVDRVTPVDVVSLSSAATVVAGGDHTCALTLAGGLKCWGRNDNGQLGDGTLISRTTPVDVSGLTSGVIAVAAGGDHTCALTSAGGLKCWGLNDDGQLGNGTIVSSTTPIDVTSLTSGVGGVGAGNAHTCAFTSAGGLKCWGANPEGQLGNGTIVSSTTPIDVTGLSSGIAGVHTGTSHTCALTTTGGLKCWGRNFGGQLGTGNNTPSSTPLDVSGLTSGVATFTTGAFHTCAVTLAGGLKCWGFNGSGLLGDGTTTNRNAPVVIFKADQAITFAPIADRTIISPSFALTATASSALTVTYASNTPAVCSMASNVVSLAGLGLCTITASQLGDADFNPALDVVRSFTVTKANQAITFGAIADTTLISPAFSLSATASSGLTITFSSTTNSVCSLAGNTVTSIGVGTCVITATQPGNASYNPALDVVRSFTVTKANQAITFNSLVTKTVQSPPFVLSATASSGLSITFASTTASVCSVVSNTVTLLGVGPCSITASQPGNAIYNPALSVSRTFTVIIGMLDQTITFNPISNTTLLSSSFGLSATASSGLTVTFTSTTASVCSVTGSTVVLIGTGTCTITATQTGNAEFNPAPSVSRSFTVTKASQVITFNPIANTTLLSSTIGLSATASSGLSITFISSSASVCSVVGSTVTLVGTGTCTLTATQTGNAVYTPAANVLRSFVIDGSKVNLPMIVR